MCGIVGVVNLLERPAPAQRVLLSMLGMLQHRGPDGFGIYRDDKVGLGSARLSIIDLEGGDQPIGNEDGSLWIVYNGEVFNYVELRPQLEARGHRFVTQSDTEVIVHLYEEYGPDCVRFLNGQFALALWDARERRLFLARDRLGIRPLFYAEHDGRLLFGSEVKALLSYPGMRAEIDGQALEQVFTYWSTLTPGSIFRGIKEVPPGCTLTVDSDGLRLRHYWRPDFATDPGSVRTDADCADELEALLIDAARLRMRADVPVGAYLSGGLDSSLTTAIVRDYTDSRLETFSIAFDNREFDESAYQLRMADYLGTVHHVVRCTDADVGRVFDEVVWHTETPILRTAPAPLFMLSQLVHENGLKVVVTGEGADEVLAGYDIFKEMAIRRFWARAPESAIRPMLLRRLYPDIGGLSRSGSPYLTAFFRRDLEATASPYYSHTLRWTNTGRIRRFIAGAAESSDAAPWEREVALPDDFGLWPTLGQAQYLEMTIFLSQYLLSSQGDRVAMAHSVEGRYPFLDYRLVEFGSRLPPGLKLRGLTEKWLLRRVASGHLPEEVWRRPKRPYRAPIHTSFFGEGAPEYVAELLEARALRESGLFAPDTVEQLVRKATSGRSLSEVEDMALAGILSTQLLYKHFVKDYAPGPPATHRRMKIVDHTRAVGIAQ